LSLRKIKFNGFSQYQEENKQNYKQVFAGDMVYNPHRVNVGSIGIVPKKYDGGYVSGIYVVFREREREVPPEYIVNLLKTKQYLNIIEAYDTKYGAVRANLNYEMLCKIKIPILPKEKLTTFLEDHKELIKIEQQYNKQENNLSRLISTFTGNNKTVQIKNGS
jgi:hypothetical protein